MAILNEEQSMLRDMAASWTTNESPVTKFRALRDSGSAVGYDPAVYKEMAEMGWSGVIIPEEYGGSDFGYLSLGLVLEETGKTLTASPLRSSALNAASALILGGDSAQKAKYLPQIASGDLIATLAVDEGPRHDPTTIETRATASGNGWALTGVKAFVAEGDSADLFVVAARNDTGIALYLVEGDAVTRASRKMADSRSHAFITLDNTPAQLLGPEDGAELLEKVLDRARVGAAAEMLGMAGYAFNETLEYLKTRVQFDQIIASFQALQHRMAKLFTEIELMRSTVEGALEAIDAGRSDVPQLASLAKAVANDTLHLMTREMIQLHGGIGMTDEHDAGFYIKRARVLETAWGNASFHKDRFASLNNY